MGTLIAELVETGDKRDSRGRRVTLAERRAELLKAYREAGLTMAAFARREGVKYSTFVGWVNKSGRRPARRRAPVRFAELNLPVPIAPAVFEVRLPDGTVLRGGEAAGLAALVRALRA